FPAVPGHLHTLTVMGEVIQIEPALIILGTDDVPQLFSKARLAIGGEAHHLVFVAIFGKTEELREGGIEDAQRMREGAGPSYFDLISLSDAPHHAAEIPEAVDGDDCGLLKR